MTRIEDIVQTFELLGDWETRYQYLSELGERLPPMPAEWVTEDNRVKACMSKVWVKALPDPDKPGAVRYVGDCDTAIIKGVVALLVDLFSGLRPQDIAAIEPDALFERTGLAEHLSPSRHIGVYAIVDLMKKQAAAHAAAGHA